MITSILGQRQKISFDEIEDMINQKFSAIPLGTFIEQQTKETSLDYKNILVNYPKLLTSSDPAPYKGTFSQFKGKQAFQVNIDKKVVQQILKDIEKQNVESAKAILPDEYLTAYESAARRETLAGIDLPSYQIQLITIDKNHTAVAFEIGLDEAAKQSSYTIIGRFSADEALIQLVDPLKKEAFTTFHATKQKSNTAKETITVSLEFLGLGKFAGDITITPIENGATLAYEIRFIPAEQSIVSSILPNEKNMSLLFKGKISHQQL